MSTKYFVINSGYKEAEFAIYSDGQPCSYIKEDNKKVSKNFITNLELLLKNCDLSFEQLSFIVANQGPAPFTTLRVALAAINGFSFASGIPLIGVNGLQVFLEEYKNPDTPTVAILNAFANELYYAIWDPENKTTTLNYAPTEELLENLNNKFDGQIIFIGNGTEMYLERIKDIMGDKAIIPEPLPLYVSIDAVAKDGYQKFQKNKDLVTELMPLYLKDGAPKYQNSQK